MTTINLEQLEAELVTALHQPMQVTLSKAQLAYLIMGLRYALSAGEKYDQLDPQSAAMFRDLSQSLFEATPFARETTKLILTTW